MLFLTSILRASYFMLQFLRKQMRIVTSTTLSVQAKLAGELSLEYDRLVLARSTADHSNTNEAGGAKQFGILVLLFVLAYSYVLSRYRCGP